MPIAYFHCIFPLKAVLNDFSLYKINSIITHSLASRFTKNGVMLNYAGEYCEYGEYCDTVDA